MEQTESGTTESAAVTRVGLADCQVCVPKDWSDEQVLAFAHETGLDHGWTIRREGHEALRGDPERRQCEAREGFVHIMLEC